MIEQLSADLPEMESLKKELQVWFDRGLLVEQPITERVVLISYSVAHRCREQLRQLGPLSVPELLTAGYVFVNFLGDGERPIFAQQLTMPDGSHIDCARRAFLTREELNEITRTTDQKYRELYEAKGVTNKQDVARHMLQTISLHGQITNYMHQLQSDNSPLAVQIDSLIKTGLSLGMPQDNGTRFDIVQKLASIYLVGGLAVSQDYFSSANRNGDRLLGQNPFLDQPWVFGHYVDYQLCLAEPIALENKELRVAAHRVRLNTVVAYLASYGLENTQREDPAVRGEFIAGDQEYCDIGTYLRTAYNFQHPTAFEVNPLLSERNTEKSETKPQPKLSDRLRAKWSPEFKAYQATIQKLDETEAFLTDMLTVAHTKPLNPLILFTSWEDLVLLYLETEPTKSDEDSLVKKRCLDILQRYTHHIFSSPLQNHNGQTMYNLAIRYHFSRVQDYHLHKLPSLKPFIAEFDAYRSSTVVATLNENRGSAFVNINPKVEADSLVNVPPSSNF
jgi:hypothetical protein